MKSSFKKGFQALMAEWLRRVIRNHLGSSRAGSNPVQCALFFIFFFEIDERTGWSENQDQGQR